jgi:hypothetical protein
MLSFTRILGLAAAAALVALTAASITAIAPVGPHERILLDLNGQIGECQLHRRAIARRACLARAGDEVRIDTAENK